MIFTYESEISIGTQYTVRSVKVKSKYLPLSNVEPDSYGSKKEFVTKLVKRNPAPVGFTYIYDARPNNDTFGVVYRLDTPIAETTNLKLIKRMAAQKGAVIIPGNMFDVKYAKPIVDEKFIVYPFRAGGKNLALFKCDPKACRDMLPKRTKKRKTNVRKGEIPVATIRSFRDFLIGMCRDDELGIVLRFRGYAAKSRKHWMLETAAIAHAVKFFVPEEKLFENRRYKEYIKDFFDYVPIFLDKGDASDKKFAKWVDSEYAAVFGTQTTVDSGDTTDENDDEQLPDIPEVLQFSRLLDLGGLDDVGEEEDQNSAI